jgi:hypothetical protein
MHKFHILNSDQKEVKHFKRLFYNVKFYKLIQTWSF